MRVLVEQTRDVVQGWLHNLALAEQVRVYVLLGGEDVDDWYLYPEHDAILIGTQDMLLSRALNRGYGMSRYAWPIDFGLLHNDCLWVFDEVQLMNVAAATSTQLEAFRRKFGTLRPTRCIWMSATLDPRWLHTVDVDRAWLPEPLTLNSADLAQPEVNKRYRAVKRLSKVPVPMSDESQIAEWIVHKHQPGTLTLAIFNTVDRARAVYQQLAKRRNPKKGLLQDVSLVLLHSRFRPREREHQMRLLLDSPPSGGTIAVTTQVVEAGVDISAKTLLTELAPWASLVQRFGRCNRRGEFQEAQVFWIDLPQDEKAQKKFAQPYVLADLVEARGHLETLHDVNVSSLETKAVPLKLQAEHVLRLRDFVDLFDTTPDLSGNDIDTSRFIRCNEDPDVRVFWRDVPEHVSHPEVGAAYAAAPTGDELCNVPVYEFRSFLRKHPNDIWRWDALEGQWTKVDNEHVFPGQTFLVRATAGGYDPTFGWDSTNRARVQPVDTSISTPEGYDHDRFSAKSCWQSLAEHADELCQALQHMVACLNLDQDLVEVLLLAARWHDYGKAHSVFQSALPDGAPQHLSGQVVWAKAAGTWKPYERRHFRHELASALAILARPHESLRNLSDAQLSLVAYLAAAHHGKVRLSIRSMPGEAVPPVPNQLYARGIWHGDTMPTVDLGGQVIVDRLELSLEPMQLGRNQFGEPSWAERTLMLREHLGPFRLGYLEALLRAADMRVSRNAVGSAPTCNSVSGYAPEAPV